MESQLVLRQGLLINDVRHFRFLEATWSVGGNPHSMGALQHRGLADDGLWVDCTAGIALATRRLAILELSPAS